MWWALTHLRALGLLALGLVVLLIHVSVLVYWIRSAEAGHIGPPRCARSAHERDARARRTQPAEPGEGGDRGAAAHSRG